MKSRARVIAGVAYYCAGLAFLVYAVSRVSFDNTLALSVTALWNIPVAILLALVARYGFAWIWIRLVTPGPTSLKSFRVLLRAFKKAWLARYIPLPAASLASRLVLSVAQGADRQRAIAASLLEPALQMTANLLLVAAGISVLSDSFGPYDMASFILVPLACMFAFVVSPPILKIVARSTARGSKMKEWKDVLSWRDYVVTLAGHLALSLSSGLILTFVIISLGAPLTWHLFASAITAAAVASSATLLALFAPAGIGVREPVMALVLTILYSEAISFSSALVVFLVSLGADVIFWILGIRFPFGQPRTRQDRRHIRCKVEDDPNSRDTVEFE